MKVFITVLFLILSSTWITSEAQCLYEVNEFDEIEGVVKILSTLGYMGIK